MGHFPRTADLIHTVIGVGEKGNQVQQALCPLVRTMARGAFGAIPVATLADMGPPIFSIDHDATLFT